MGSSRICGHNLFEILRSIIIFRDFLRNIHSILEKMFSHWNNLYLRHVYVSNRFYSTRKNISFITFSLMKTIICLQKQNLHSDRCWMKFMSHSYAQCIYCCLPCICLLLLTSDFPLLRTNPLWIHLHHGDDFMMLLITMLQIFHAFGIMIAAWSTREIFEKAKNAAKYSINSNCVYFL